MENLLYLKLIFNIKSVRQKKLGYVLAKGQAFKATMTAGVLATY